jgi:HAD superfamily hydrolase (TIGR01509 family)
MSGPLAVLLDYFFTLADPRPSGEVTLDALLADLLPGETREAFDAERAALLADGGWAPRELHFDGPPPQFRSSEEGWRAYGDVLLSRFGVTQGGQAYARARYQAHARAPLFPDIVEALTALTAGGHRLGVLSDADAYLHDNIAAHGLCFDVVLSSGHLGCYKPHVSLFHAACAAIGQPPEATVYVGDNPDTDIEGARRAGLRAIWVDRGLTTWPPSLTPPEVTISALTDLPASLAPFTTT